MSSLAAISRSRRTEAALAAAGVAVLAVVAPAAVAMLSPALVLIFALWLGAFPDEQAVAWVRRVVRRLRARTARPAQPLAAARPVLAFAAGIDASFALAMRPPPRGALR